MYPVMHKTTHTHTNMYVSIYVCEDKALKKI